MESYPARETQLGSLQIIRALPARGRRLVGPWCFLDRYGPLTFTQGRPMDVVPHPHIGLQTVSWLLEGEILHDDSLGYRALLQAGGVNIMTSGAGIAHSEQTPASHSGNLSGVQLWVALPDRDRQVAASLQHIERVPCVDTPGGIIQIFSGSLNGWTSPARHFSEIVGADIAVNAAGSLELPLRKDYEHAVLLLGGQCSFGENELQPGTLYYLATGHDVIRFSSATGGRLLLLGGQPFPESILMWWNFVARTPAEIAEAREEWEQHSSRFGEVRAYNGSRLVAPELGKLVQPNPAS